MTFFFPWNGSENDTLRVSTLSACNWSYSFFNLVFTLLIIPDKTCRRGWPFGSRLYVSASYLTFCQNRPLSSECVVLHQFPTSLCLFGIIFIKWKGHYSPLTVSQLPARRLTSQLFPLLFLDFLFCVFSCCCVFLWMVEDGGGIQGSKAVSNSPAWASSHLIHSHVLTICQQVVGSSYSSYRCLPLFNNRLCFDLLLLFNFLK